MQINEQYGQPLDNLKMKFKSRNDRIYFRKRQRFIPDLDVKNEEPNRRC